MQALISLERVDYRMGDKSILQHIDFTLHSNEIVTIVGPNGAGKSTLLSLVLKLNQPTAGTVSYHQPLKIGYVPQSVNRDYTMPVSVLDFIMLTKQRKKKHEAIAIIQELGLTGLQSAFISELSGGELRRVLLARALLNHPDVLVLDEPTAGVDVSGQEQFYQQLGQWRDKYQFAILMVSHDLHLVMSKTDRVLCLNQHICCQGQPVQVLKDPHYLALFGQHESINTPESSELAFYEHHHDHTH